MNVRIIVLCMLIMTACIIIPVNADEFQSDDTKYIISPWFNFGNNSYKAVPIYGNIIDGNWVIHPYFVTSGRTKMEIAVEWNKDQYENDLALTVTRPDDNIYGPFYDSYDGLINGVIPIVINGNLAIGNWIVSVYGKSVIGSQQYKLTINVI